MSALNKFLIGILVLAAIIIGVEVLYYFAYKPKTTQVTTSTVIPTTAPTDVVAPNVTQQPRMKENGLNLVALRGLRSLKRGVIRQSTLSNRYRGTITVLYTQEGSYSTGFKYRYGIRIEGGKKFSNLFLYSKEEVEKLKVFKKINNKLETIRFEDLKVGDDVVILETLDLMKPLASNITSLRIILQSVSP